VTNRYLYFKNAKLKESSGVEGANDKYGYHAAADRGKPIWSMDRGLIAPHHITHIKLRNI